MTIQLPTWEEAYQRFNDGNATVLDALVVEMTSLDSSGESRRAAVERALGDIYEQGFAAAKKDTGLKDIHGRAVLAGNKVWCYPQDYEVISVDDSGPIPVHEVDTTKPKPVPDTPLVRGEVYWSTDQLMWVIKVSWQTPTWDSIKYASVALAHYAVEVHDE